MNTTLTDPIKPLLSSDVLLHRNAAPVYAFLSLIGSPEFPKTILDCGAGGPLPSLALFAQHGFQAYGIDVDPDQLNKAELFCQQKGIPVLFRQGDMRNIPYDNESFDYVYEHYSMCHLNKADTQLAVHEMFRVLKPNGMCFLGVISTDTWPHSFFGDERAPGEFYGEEGGRKDVLHSMFSDREAEALVPAWEIVSQEKHVQYLRQAALETSMDAWMSLREEFISPDSMEDWKEMYSRRAQIIQYVHLYYILRKPS